MENPKTGRLEPWTRLDGKVVLVTGASSGIGRVICLDLARAGCRVIAAARRVDRLESLCEEINRVGLGSARSVELDIGAGGSEIRAGIKRCWDAFEGIDTLINNAGVRARLEPWGRLEGKVVLVTGASSGLGRVICLDLARAGCRVVAAARRIDRLESLCEEINRVGSGSARAVELDIGAGGSEIRAGIKRCWDAFGGIDALVNNAGVRGTIKSPLDISEDEWNNTIRTNLTGTWLVSKYVCTLMRDNNRGGSVINISSISGINRGDLPGGVAYSTSKSGVNTLTKVMAMELGKYKIRVNSISPGLFESEITEVLVKKDWLKNVHLKTIPLRDNGTSDPALTSLVRYLVHDSSEYISGNFFIVDAGATLPGVPIFSSL